MRDRESQKCENQIETVKKRAYSYIYHIILYILYVRHFNANVLFILFTY